MSAVKKVPPCDFPINLAITMQQVPLQALCETAKQTLSAGLNPLLFLMTTNNTIRDYRGLAELLEYPYSEILQLSNESDPTAVILSKWNRKSTIEPTIGNLLYILDKLERFDLIDDLKHIFMVEVRNLMKYLSPKEVHDDASREAEKLGTKFGLKYISRPSWGAFKRSRNHLMVSPVQIVFIHHSVTPADRDPYLSITGIQAYKIIFYGHEDVVYNMLISSDGTVFEGFGWDYRGSHTMYYNYLSISIGLLGNYEESVPDPRMIESIHKLIRLGIHLGKIHPEYGLYAHCDASETQSPGKHIIEHMSSWPRFHALGPLPDPSVMINQSIQQHHIPEVIDSNTNSSKKELPLGDNISRNKTQNEAKNHLSDNRPDSSFVKEDTDLLPMTTEPKYLIKEFVTINTVKGRLENTVIEVKEEEKNNQFHPTNIQHHLENSTDDYDAEIYKNNYCMFQESTHPALNL